MTTDDKRKCPPMLATQPAMTTVNDEPPSLESLEGASFRFALAPKRAEMRTTGEEEVFRLTAEAKSEHKSKAQQLPALDPQQELFKLLKGLTGRRSHWQVFSDFCEMGAISFSNSVDLAHQEKREERYLQIVKGYESEELSKFAEGLAHLTMALEAGFSDVLGRTFHDLELHNKWAGQFFTPYPVCKMMAQMTIGDTADLNERIKERGFVTAQEPAVGTGAMVIALAEAMLDAGVNYQEHLHVTAIDVDLKCVHMAYLQFSLLHIPAVIVHGNTLSLEEWSHWHTPAHLMGGWTWKLRRREETEERHEIHAPPPAEAAPGERSPEPKQDAPLGQLKLF